MDFLILKQRCYLLSLALIVSIGGMLYGYDLGIISGALLFIQDTIPMSKSQVGYIVGAVLGGALIGTLLAGPLADRFGRKRLILLASILSILGIFCVVYARTFISMFIARVILGVGVGFVVVAVPLYVVEVVAAKHRGKFMTGFQLFLTLGIVLAYTANLYYAPTRDWQSMFLVGLYPSCLLFIGMFFLPESPRYLLLKRQSLAAFAVLKKLRRLPDAQAELKHIAASLARPHSHWHDLFAIPHLAATCTALLVAIFNQMTGINSFLQYAPIILKTAGIRTDLLSLLGSLGIGILNFIGTLVAILFIDTLGRRPLLITGIIGVVCSELFLGTVSWLALTPTIMGILSLIGLLAFILFFAIGPGVVGWLVITELFPTPIRGKGTALCLFVNSLASTLLATFFLPLSHYLKMAGTYWLFALFSLGYFLTIYYLLPETKAKSLEAIQTQLQGELATE